MDTFTLLNGRELRTSFKPDGTEVRANFETDQGRIEIASTPEAFWNLANQITQLAIHALAIKSQASPGPRQVQIAEIARAKAETPIGAPIVALGLVGSAGNVQHFGLSPELSATLRGEMEAAERQALDNRKKISQ